MSTGNIFKQRALVGGSSPFRGSRRGSLRGALRRPFTLEERLRQRAYESAMLALKPPEESEDEEASSTPKVLSIRRDLKRSKRPPALITSAGLPTTSSCGTSLTTVETRPSVLDGTPFQQRISETVDHCIPEPARRPSRPAPRSHDDHPHASARSPTAPNQSSSSSSSSDNNEAARSNAPFATVGSTARVPRRRLSLQARRGSLVTGASSSPSPIRPSLRPRSNSSPPNVLISSAIHRYINIGVHSTSAPTTPTLTSFSPSEIKGKAVDSTSSVDFRSAFVSQSCGAHLMDTLKKWL